MPIEKHHLNDLDLLVLLGHGTVSVQDFHELYQSERGRDGVRTHDVLMDLRRVEALVVEHPALKSLVAEDAGMHADGDFEAGRRRAVVGRFELDESMVVLYRALLRRGHGAGSVAEATSFFSTLDEALAFLAREADGARIEATLDAMAASA